MYSSTIPTANGNAPHTEAHLIRRLFVKACCAHYLVSVYFGSSDCNHSTIRAKQLITGQSFYITTELNLLLILHRGLKTLVSTDKQPSLTGATHARVYLYISTVDLNGRVYVTKLCRFATGDANRYNCQTYPSVYGSL